MSSAPPALQAALLLLFAEAAYIHGDDSTARKLIEEATALPLACWSGLRVSAFQVQTGTNLPPDSPFLQNLQHHPLTVYLGQLSAYDPEAALRIATYVCPRRAELPNLATLWVAVLEAVPATANLDAMERLFTFTDRHVRDFCETTNDYRELMDRYLTAMFRNKDRFSELYIGNAVLQSTNSLLRHLRETFGADWAFPRLLRGMTQLLTPPTKHPERAGVYQQCAANVITIINEEVLQKGGKVAIQTLAYFLRLRFEAGLPIDEGLLRTAVAYAFEGLLKGKVHAMKFVEPIRVLYPVAPKLVEEIAQKANFRLVHDDVKQVARPDDHLPGTVHLTMMMTSSPDHDGLATAVLPGNDADAAAAMHRSKGMVDFRTILITDPLHPLAAKTPEAEDDGETRAFVRNREILAAFRDGKRSVPPAASQWRSQWKQGLRLFIAQLVSQAAIGYGEAARPIVQKVMDCAGAAELHESRPLLEALIAAGTAQSGQRLTTEQLNTLMHAAIDRLKNDDDYGLTMLAWAAPSHPSPVLEAIRSLGSTTKEWVYWLVLFRDVRVISNELRNAGIERALQLSDAVDSETDLRLGMEVLLLLPESAIWEETRKRLEATYERLPRKAWMSRHLCTALLDTADEVRRHPQYAGLIEDHLERIATYWLDEHPDDHERRKLANAFRDLTKTFARNTTVSLMPQFEEILNEYDSAREWSFERALLFPREAVAHAQSIRNEIESSRTFADRLPDHLRGISTFMDAFARAVARERDPRGNAVSGHFADLVEVAYRSNDPNIYSLMEEALSEFPSTAVPTIAAGVITRALTIGDVETARQWLPRARGLLNSAIEEFDDSIPETDAGMEFVMDMIATETSPDIVSRTARIFAATCVELGPDAASASADECLALLGDAV